MAGRAAIIAGCAGRLLLTLLAFVLAVPASGAGPLGLTPVVHNYDGAASAAELASEDAPQAALDQDVRGKRRSTASLRSGYDDRSQLAGASARLGGYRLTPSGAIGFADDAVGSAYQGMRSGGGHAMRHLIDEGLIPNSGTLASRAGTFQNLTSPILQRDVGLSGTLCNRRDLRVHS